jgi:hypothetical protein
MEYTVYFAAGLWFRLYFLAKWTKWFNFTVQLPCTTTDKNYSIFTFKKSSFMNKTQHPRIQSYTYYHVCSMCYLPHFHLAIAD